MAYLDKETWVSKRFWNIAFSYLKETKRKANEPSVAILFAKQRESKKAKHNRKGKS